MPFSRSTNQTNLPSAQKRKEEKSMSESLYERLGGEMGLSAIVRDALKKHQNNPIVKTRFQDSDMDALHRLAVDFFGMGSGGPQKYGGKDMRSAHRSMNISEEEYMAVIDDILAALDEHQVAPDTRNEVLGILYSLKGEIVRG
jgi:hemoglobin